MAGAWDNPSFVKETSYFLYLNYIYSYGFLEPGVVCVVVHQDDTGVHRHILILTTALSSLLVRRVGSSQPGACSSSEGEAGLAAGPRCVRVLVPIMYSHIKKLYVQHPCAQ